MEEPKVEEKKKTKSIGTIILDIIGYVLIAAIAILIAYTFWSRAKGDIPFVGNYSVMYVTTGSMEPVIPTKSYIFVKRVYAKDVEVEDVIVFISDDPALNGAYNTHRVVEIVGDHEEFVTKGDNNLIKDSYTAKGDKVIAKFISNLVVLTAIGRFISSPIGITMALTFIFIIFMFIYLPEMKKTMKETEEELKAEKDKYIDELVKAQVEKMLALDAEKKQAEKSDNGSYTDNNDVVISDQTDTQEEGIEQDEKNAVEETDSEVQEGDTGAGGEEE